MLLLPALVLLIALAPVYGIVSCDTATGWLAAGAAFALASTWVSARNARKLAYRLRWPLLSILLTPLVWMVIQLVPTSLVGLADPVWASTAAALDLPIAGSISIDTGSTLLVVVKYCAALAVAAATAAHASDRRSAEQILYLLTAMSGLITATELIRNWSSFRLMHAPDSEPGLVFIAATGVVLSFSVLIQIWRRASGKKITRQPWVIAFIGTSLVLLLCTTSLLISDQGSGLFAALFGAGVPVSIFAIRRWSLRMWGRLGLLATASMALIGFLAVTPIKTDADPTLALSPSKSLAAEMLLSNVPLLGTGAGSVKDVLPIYHALNAPAEFPSVTAATIAGEMGKPFFWLLIITLAIVAIMLIRSASERRRDYIYAATGAGILLAFSMLVFVYSDVLALPSSLLAALALGLAWAQAQPDEDTRLAHDQPWPNSNKEMRKSVGPRQRRIRFACGALALLLAGQACWVLIPNLYLSPGLPDSQVNAGNAGVHIDNLDRAASIAMVRGDLWGKSALARAAMMKDSPSSVEVRGHLIKALTYAPYQPKVWLKFAQFADQFKWTRYSALALLKMVYYTGVSEIDLVPPRTKLALRLDDATAGLELEDMIKRDVELILRQRPDLIQTLVEAYRSATPTGRALADSVVARLEPRLLGTLRGQ